jgi:hypothetical protein
MSAREIALIFVWALAAAGIIALLLSAIPVFQPQRERFPNRFGYAFSVYGIPVWCVIELVFWLITHRWVP